MWIKLIPTIIISIYRLIRDYSKIRREVPCFLESAGRIHKDLNELLDGDLTQEDILCAKDLMAQLEEEIYHVTSIITDVVPIEK